MDREGVEEFQHKIVLVGAPNSGKTTLFNYLTGLNQRVGNFPGVTVERKSAPLKIKSLSFELVDLPGTNSLYPESEDERISCEILRNPTHPDHPDKVVLVVDITQLRRGLLLCSQVIDLGIPMVLVLNMVDLVDENEQVLAKDKLEKELQVPVVMISAKKELGLDLLKEKLRIPLKAPGKQMMKLPAGLSPSLTRIKEILGHNQDFVAFQALLRPEDFNYVEPEVLAEERKKAGIDKDATQGLISNELIVRYDYIDHILDEVWVNPPGWLEKLTSSLDRLLVHKVWGYVFFGVILMLIFQSIFSWANYPMDLIDLGVEGLKDLVSKTLPSGWGRDLLTEGVITGFGGIVIFIPQIALLFFFIAIMEETGYMARVVFLMDRIMRPFGFSGKSVIPLMGGMACAIPSIMMTRNISNKTERLITMMVTPLMSCSARIPVYALLIALFLPAKSIWIFDQRGLVMTGLYLLGFLMALFVAWIFKTALKYKADGVFVMELPVFKMPKWKNVGLTVFQKVIAFVFGAGRIILAITILLWVLVNYGPSAKREEINQRYELAMSTEGLNKSTVDSLQSSWDTERLESSFAAIGGKWIEPAIRPLGYDWKIGIALITSFAAREVFVGTISIIYNQKDPEGLEGEEEQALARSSLINRLKKEKFEGTSELVYTRATALSLLIFYVFAMQCMSTLAITRKEAGWKWAGIMLVYLTALAYFAAWITYLIAQ